MLDFYFCEWMWRHKNNFFFDSDSRSSSIYANYLQFPRKAHGGVKLDGPGSKLCACQNLKG